MWWSIDGVYDGSSDAHRSAFTTNELEHEINGLAAEYRDAVKGSDSVAEIFVLDHFCKPTDEDCVCSQYATDHHPFVTIRGQNVLAQ